MHVKTSADRTISHLTDYGVAYYSFIDGKLMRRMNAAKYVKDALECTGIEAVQYLNSLPVTKATPEELSILP